MIEVLNYLRYGLEKDVSKYDLFGYTKKDIDKLIGVQSFWIEHVQLRKKWESFLKKEICYEEISLLLIQFPGADPRLWRMDSD